MTLTTPAGTPASSRIGISASMVSGVSEAGLSTTGQPAASAGPILRVAIAAGKFHGVTSTATPAGLCCTTMRAPEAGAHDMLPILRTRLLRVPAEELGRIGHLAARIRQRLAVLDGDQLGEPLGVAHDQLVGLAQNLGALARLLRGPARERVACGIDRGLGVLDAWRSRPRRSCSRSPDRSRRSGRRRRPCAICRRSRDRSGHWRADCRTSMHRSCSSSFGRA